MKTKKQKKTKSRFDIYDDREDAYTSGYSDGVNRVIDLLIIYSALDSDFLSGILRDFVARHNKIQK